MDFLQESAVCFFLFCFFSGLDASGMRIISPVQESIWSRSTGFPRKRDISYYKSYTYTAYEFKIPEESFKKHANSSWRFREIREPEVIRRYNYIREYEEYHKNYREFRYEEYRRLQERTTATVKNGIVARHRQRNGGGYHAVYDRDTGTAYVQTNPR